jgi:hypothetical protein
MNWLWVLLSSTFGCAALGFLYQAVFGDHDPGAVFPWMFMALIYAAGGAVIGLCGGVIFELVKFLFFRV